MLRSQLRRRTLKGFVLLVETERRLDLKRLFRKILEAACKKRVIEAPHLTWFRSFFGSALESEIAADQALGLLRLLQL